MFLIRSRHPQPPGPALTASPTLTPDQAQRRARHLRQCERLGELGMELAEAVHREALRDIKPRPERRASPFPGMPDLPAPFFPRDSTYGQLFAKLSRCVRQTIMLEARLAAGAYDFCKPTPARAAPVEPTPPRSAPKSSAPETRPRLHAEELEDDSAADAGRSPEEILAGICAELAGAVESGLPAAKPAQTPGRPDTARKPHDGRPKPPPLSQARAPQNGIPPPSR